MSILVYPLAVQKPLINHSWPGVVAQRNQVVEHIAECPTIEGVYATFAASVTPNRVSAHFIVDRKPPYAVWQCLPLDQTAWHASQVNIHSVGIEHVAMSAYGANELNQAHSSEIAAGKMAPCEEMLVVDGQYHTSAALLVWICSQLRIPVDRAHVRTHNEASPRDGHVYCCTGALDIDRLVAQAAALQSTT